MVEGRLWKQASLFIWAQLGNLQWAHSPGTLRDLLLEYVAADNEATNLLPKWV
jgi:hypothetical protein